MNYMQSGSKKMKKNVKDLWILTASQSLVQKAKYRESMMGTLVIWISWEKKEIRILMDMQKDLQIR